MKFPLLIIASDGWVDYFKKDEDLSAFNYIAIKKYNQLKPHIIDSAESVWQITEISAKKPLTFLDKFLAHTFHNPLIPVTIQVEKITEKPIDTIKQALMHAIDADDDILTQWCEASELKKAVESADSFKSLIATLKKKKAI